MDKPCVPLWHLVEGTYTSWVLRRGGTWAGLEGDEPGTHLSIVETGDLRRLSTRLARYLRRLASTLCFCLCWSTLVVISQKWPLQRGKGRSSTRKQCSPVCGAPARSRTSMMNKATGELN